jgi:lysophospholipid acyltransferase (LPLAT)-like uncharacterized protein
VGKLLKTVGRKPLVQRLVAALAAGLMGMVRRTTRWQTINAEAAGPAWNGRAPVIVAFWHNRLALMPACWPSRQPFHMLISSHPDGRLIARAVEHFGFGTIAGSSTRGGGDAMRALVRALKGGASVGVTPDGPRGPRMTVGDGVLALARLAGVPILPVAVSVSRRVVLRTWDRLIIPLPFGSGAMIWGDPIAVPRDADDAALDALRLRLEQEMTRVSVQADTLTGHIAILPAEALDARA